MKATIENYRGFEISFDTEKEMFYCFSDSWDNESLSKSFAGIKRYVDEYIKNNNSFKPFFIETIPNGNRERNKLKVVGIRKDGGVNVERDGKVEKISTYNEKDWIISDGNNDEIWGKIEIIDKEIDVLRDERQLIAGKATGTPLIEYKKQFII